MPPRRSTLASCLFALFGCATTRLPPPPPDPPNELTLDAERIRRGAAPVTVAADTERDEGRIRVAVLQRRTSLQECFERILPANPDAEGRVDVTFVVETSGLIHDAVGETSVAPLRPTKECVLGIVRALRIEGVQHASVVRFPFEFENPLLELNLAEIALHPRMRITVPTSAAVAVQAGTGELSSGEVQTLLDAQAQPMLACYTPMLRGPLRRGQQRPQGTARFELTVAPDGALADIDRVETSDPVPQATDCILGILQGMHFRSTGRRTIVRLRFAMRPQEAPAAAAAQP